MSEKWEETGPKIAVQAVLWDGESRCGTVTWYNEGQRLDIDAESSTVRVRLKEFVSAVTDSTGRRGSKSARGRTLVRTVAKQWRADGNRSDVVTDCFRIRVTTKSVADLPFDLLAALYWRPQALGIRSSKRSSETAPSADRRHSILPHLRKNKWPTEETWVNKAVDALLAAIPPSATAAALHSLYPQLALVDPRFCKVSTSQLSHHVGAPDFALYDHATGTIVLGEIKIGAKSTNGRYGFEQFTKYMLASALLQLSRVVLVDGKPETVKATVHVVIGPGQEIGDWCIDNPQWSPSVGPDRRLQVRPDAIAVKPRHKAPRYRNFLDWQKYVCGFLTDPEVAAANEVDVSQVDAVMAQNTLPCLVPALVFSWDDLARSLRESCAEHGARHLISAIEQIRQMGNGDPK